MENNFGFIFENSSTGENPNINSYSGGTVKLKPPLRRYIYKGIQYRVFIINKATTSTPSAQVQLIDEFIDIVTRPFKKETEKERSSLIIELKEFLSKYGSDGFDIVKTYIELQYRKSNETLISDLLEILGEVEDLDSKN